MSKPPSAPMQPGDSPPLPDSDVARADTQTFDADLVAAERPTFDALGAAAELEAALAESRPEADASPATTSDSYVALLEAETEELSALVARKDERIQTLENEAESVRTRVERAAEKDVEQRTRSLVLGFLDVLDDLDRALAAARRADVAPAVVEGMELVRKRFLGRLGELRVRHVPALGTRFDPGVHEAMSVMPTQDAEQDGMVVGVMREGYVMGEESLRPAGVAVAKLARS